VDLGAVSHEEIAVAVLAEMVKEKAAGAGRGFELATAAPSAVDPVCGMAVDRADARHRFSHEGREFLFCSASCRGRFAAEPAAFVSVLP
jgi:YHS domain-containing protein